MCGIAGTVGGPPPDPGLLARMAERMAHRGPDAQGVWTDGVAGLGFRRLAIIDLDPRSNQPMHLGAWHLVFNGEIYNYRELRAELERLGHTFHTEGDAEVLLHAWAEWEEAALDRFNGMFAFAVWNGERRELTLACDPFGEKPLFWAHVGETFVFASDIRAMLERAPGLAGAREAALGPFLALGLTPPIDESFFARVSRLPGAHVLRLRDGETEARRYWLPRETEVPSAYDGAVERLRELLTDSVRLRLRSDVPVGTSLSGGIDSSAVAGLTGQLAPEATRHAFTARFRGFERDEWHYAQQVAARAGVVEHHVVDPTAEEMLDDLSRIVVDQEEPFGSLSIYAQWRVMQAAREAGITVLLDGQGADELFGGYDGAGGWALRSQGPGGVVRGLVGSERRQLLEAIGSERLPRTIARRYRARRLSPYVADAVAAEAVRIEAPEFGDAGTPLRRELLRQSFHTSLPQLLRYADRDSMAHAREVRLPFLDRRVAEFALSVPASFLYRDGVRKRLLRDAIRDVAPPAVLARRDKVGFEPPQARWLAQPASVTRIREVLLDARARARGVYDISAVEADAAAGHWRDPAGIWRALNVELWLAAFAGERSRAAAATA